MLKRVYLEIKIIENNELRLKRNSQKNTKRSLTNKNSKMFIVILSIFFIFLTFENIYMIKIIYVIMRYIINGNNWNIVI